jgi:hypothetical protein
MGTIMIRCPQTGRAVSTGKEVASAVAFSSAAVFFGRTYCRYCRVMHEWFARDAWVCDSEAPDSVSLKSLNLQQDVDDKLNF